MKKITIICYYELKDALASAGQALEDLGYQINSYPLFQTIHDVNDKMENYFEKFDDFLTRTKPDIILWWYFYILVNDLRKIKGKHPDIYHIFFNWDDPYSWAGDSHLPEKCQFLDLAVITCKETLDCYTKNGAKKAIFCPPGYDPKINFRQSVDNKYKCDLSFCCTNLYQDKKHFPDQVINRKKLIDELVKDSEINFHLYGPDFLSKIYPNHYKGLVVYKDLNKLFNSSKINLCTHVVSNKDGYINERTVLVLGSGGLLLVDQVKGLDDIIPTDCFIFLDTENYVTQIKKILNSDYDSVRINAENFARDNLTWKHWAKKIHFEICHDFFDPEFYQKKYELGGNSSNPKIRDFRECIARPQEFLIPGKIQDLWEHWKSVGYELGHMCYPSSQEKNIITMMNDTEDINVMSTFNMIHKEDQTLLGIHKLQQISVRSPEIDVNKLLELYFNIA